MDDYKNTITNSIQGHPLHFSLVVNLQQFLASSDRIGYVQPDILRLKDNTRLVKDSNGRHEIIKQGGERINDDTTHFRHDGCLLHLATFQRMGHVCEYEISRNSTIKEILRYKETKERKGKSIIL